VDLRQHVLDARRLGRGQATRADDLDQVVGRRRQHRVPGRI